MKLKQLLTQTTSSWAFLPLRLGIGVVMLGHGAQKLFGWFGGYGLEATGQFFAESLGLKPGILMALLAGGTEFFWRVIADCGAVHACCRTCDRWNDGGGDHHSALERLLCLEQWHGISAYIAAWLINPCNRGSRQAFGRRQVVSRVLSAGGTDYENDT